MGYMGTCRGGRVVHVYVCPCQARLLYVRRTCGVRVPQSTCLARGAHVWAHLGRVRGTLKGHVGARVYFTPTYETSFEDAERSAHILPRKGAHRGTHARSKS